MRTLSYPRTIPKSQPSPAWKTYRQGFHPGLAFLVGFAADGKRKGLRRFKTGLEFSLGPIRALYRLFNNSFVKE